MASGSSCLTLSISFREVIAQQKPNLLRKILTERQLLVLVDNESGSAAGTYAVIQHLMEMVDELVLYLQAHRLH